MFALTHIAPIRVPLAGFAAIGMGWGAYAAALPVLKDRLGLSEADLGAALFFAALGALISMAFAPRIMPRLPGGGISLGILGLGVSFSLIPFAQSLTDVIPIFCLIGLSTGFIDVVINARVSAVEAHTGRHYMSFAHGTFSLCYAIAALAMGFAREGGFTASWLYTGLGISVVMWVIFTRADTDPPLESETPGLEKEKRARLPFAVILTSILITIAFFAENATEMWSALHIEETLGGRAAQGALGPTVLGLTMAVGRFSGQGLALRFGERRVMTTMALIASLGGLVAAFAPNPFVGYIGFGGLGLGISALAPLGFSIGGKLLTNRNRAAGIARMSFLGYLGFFFGPPLLGLIGEFFGLRISFATVAVSLILVPVILSRVPRSASPDARSAQHSRKARTPAT